MSPYVIPLGRGGPNGYYMGSIGYYNKYNGPYIVSIRFIINLMDLYTASITFIIIKKINEPVCYSIRSW